MRQYISKPISGHHKRVLAIAKNAGMGIGGQLFSQAIRFVTALIITRAIGPHDYGIYVLAMSIIAMVEVFGLLGLEPAMVKFVAQYKAKSDLLRMKSVLLFGLKATFVLTFLLSAGLFAMSDLASNTIFHNQYLAPVLCVMLLGAPPTTSMLVILAGLQGARMVKFKIFVEQVLMPAFRFTAVLIVFGFGFSLMGVAWVWTITSLIGLVAAAFFAYKKIGPIFNSHQAINGREVLSFSMPLMLSRIFNQNINVIGILIVGMFCTAFEVGIYGIAMRTIPFLLVPLIAFNAIISPIFSELYAKQQMDDLEKVYKIGNKWVILITLPMFVIMVYFADVIVSIFGVGFAQAAPIMTIFLLGHMINAATGSSALVLSMTGRPMFMLYNSGGLFLLNIGLTVFLLGNIGIMGAAYAYGTSIIIIQILQLIEVWYLYRIHPYSIENLKPVISCLLSLAVIHGLDKFLISVTWAHHPPYLMLLFLLSYSCCLWSAGFSSEDRLILSKLRNRVSTTAASS